MNRRIFLVDTENVATTWQTILPELTPADTLLLFFTRNSPGVAYTDLRNIMQYAGRFECVECYPGANGLDFQLVSYLGYLLHDDSEAVCVIVSKDTGYDAVCKFWADKGRKVIRKGQVDAVAAQAMLPAVAETAPAPKEAVVADAAPVEPAPAPDVTAPAAAPAAPAVSVDELTARIRDALKSVASSEETAAAVSCFGDGTNVDQGQIHNALVIKLGANRGLEFYHLLKPVFRYLAHPDEPAALPRRSTRLTARRRHAEPKSAAVTAAPAKASPAPIEKPAEAAPVAEKAEKPAETKAESNKPAGKTAEAKSEDKKPVEAKPADKTPAEQKPASKKSAPSRGKSRGRRREEDEPVEADPDATGNEIKTRPQMIRPHPVKAAKLAVKAPAAKPESSEKPSANAEKSAAPVNKAEKPAVKAEKAASPANKSGKPTSKPEKAEKKAPAKISHPAKAKTSNPAEAKPAEASGKAKSRRPSERKPSAATKSEKTAAGNQPEKTEA